MRRTLPIYLSRLAICGLIALLAGGCGSKHGIQHVSGVVTLNGKPVEGAEVTFVPKNETAETKPARGTTDASGTYTLNTYFGPDEDPAGAVPGEYVVTVQKMPPGMVDPYKQGLPKNLLPNKFSSSKTTPLAASVTKAGPNKFDLKLVE